MKPSAQRVLNELRRGPRTTSQLMQADVGGVRFGELRALGFRIDESRLPLPTRGSRYELTFDAERELPQPSGERPTGKPGGRDEPCKGVATPSQTGTDRPPVTGALFDSSAFVERAGDYRDAA